MRKAISFILTLALLMTMVMGMPIVACAEDANPPTQSHGGNGGSDDIVSVNGIQLGDGHYLMSNDSDAATIPTEAGESTPSAFVAWYKDGTLYLRGAQFNSNASLIECNGDLNIALVGDNLLTCAENDEAIDVAGNLTFTSAEDPATGSDKVGLGWDGNLTIVSSATGIQTDGELTISSGAVIVRGGDCAVEIGQGSEAIGTPTLHMSDGTLSVLATKATGVAMKLRADYSLEGSVKPVQAATSGGVIISGSDLDSESIGYNSKDSDVRFGQQPLTYILFVEQTSSETPLESGSFCWLTKSQGYTIKTYIQSKFKCVRLYGHGLTSNDNSIYANITYDSIDYSFNDNGTTDNNDDTASFYVADEGMYIFMIIPWEQ